MAVLEGGQTWGLSSSSATSASSASSPTSGTGSRAAGRRKTAICVKLTDSSLRALEEYLNKKVKEKVAKIDSPEWSAVFERQSSGYCPSCGFTAAASNR